MARKQRGAFHRNYEAFALVVGIERNFLDSGVSIGYAHVQFGSELHRVLGFSADNRADKRLADTNDAILHFVRPACVHVELLFIQFPQSPQQVALLRS